MNITQTAYQKLVEQSAPKSKVLLQCVKAFSVGGIICCIGQGIHDLFERVLGFSQMDAGTWTSILLKLFFFFFENFFQPALIPFL